MKTIEILENKTVIRIFGVLLIFAPVMNTFVSLMVKTEIPNRWRWEIFWQLAHAWKTNFLILSVASILIGAIMLTGSTKSWRAVLVLLGGYIVFQLPDLGHNVRQNWLFAFFFLTNVFVFYLVADRLVWKIKVNPGTNKTGPARKMDSQAQHKDSAKAVKPRQAPLRQSTKKILVSFEGVGPWAQLRGISGGQLELLCFKDPPPDLISRPLEIKLQNGLILKSRFVNKTKDIYFFEYSVLTSEQKQKLNRWVYQQAS